MRLLIETDVLIDYLRAQAEAVSYLEGLTDTLLISAMTVAELYAGVRDGSERAALDSFVQALEVIPISDKIAIHGGLLRKDYAKSHNTGLADAIIAATSEIEQARLMTLNKKHFPMLANLIVPYQKS